MYRISQIARQFGLSRSTLLYYDRIGLLTPTGRSESGYRLYSAEDRERLAAICTFRQAGLTIEQITGVLAAAGDETAAVLQHRLQQIGEEIRALQAQQRLLAEMLKAKAGGAAPSLVDKKMWVEMLRNAGMDEGGMKRWHTEFERRSPQAHHDFLLSLGIPENEALLIRSWSAKG